MDDLIKRQDAINACLDGFCACVNDCVNEIKKLPSAQKTGHWDDSCYMQRCSVCGGRGKKSYKYCPYCGSLNRGEEE